MIPCALVCSCGEATKTVDGPSIQQVLAIGDGPNAEASCITMRELKGGVVDLAEDVTSFAENGELSNPECVLAMALVDGRAHFIAGPSVDIDLALPGTDGDSISHSTVTAEDPVVSGTFSMTLFSRDTLGDETRKLWSGNLFVGELGEAMDPVRVAME